MTSGSEPRRRWVNVAWLALLAVCVAGATGSMAARAAGSVWSGTPEHRAEGARRLVLCLDGTWNSTFDETRTEQGTFVLKPTNVLKLCRAVENRDSSGTSQLIFYLTGVGSVPRYPGASNAVFSAADKYLGGVWGAGFESNVEAALDFLNMNYRAGDEVYIFGFSRGAATARGVTQFLGWAGGLPTREDAYYLPLLFREFIKVRGEDSAESWIASRNAEQVGETPPRKPLEPFNRIPVTYLGVWDTVMALGSRFESTGVKNATVSRSFYVDAQPAVDVQVARQALAIDERRYDFRPEIWLSAREGQRMEQRWFPGVHSNVGGGYRHDGLANGAFLWLLQGATELGLAVNEKFVRHYRPYPQDTLYDTYSLGMAVGDALRFRRGDGVRKLSGWPASSNLSIDRSAVMRLVSDPSASNAAGEPRFPRMDGEAYRPDNLLDFIACSPEAEEQLRRGDVRSEDLSKSEDVTRDLEKRRQRCG